MFARGAISELITNWRLDKLKLTDKI